MPAKKKCFVISPIGDENSEIRKEADALLWVSKSALEKFDFEVIRVDQIARSTTITNEIIQLIQEAELCLIVLSGHNPNVFYEAGRRHETGKPFIQLIRKGETLPFDVATIRTIIYDDIQSLPAAAKVVEQIQKFIQEFEKGGYGVSGTGVSISTIAAALDRIERKVGQLMSSSSSSSSSSGNLPTSTIAVSGLHPEWEEAQEIVPGLQAFADAAKDPREKFLEAVITGNLAVAAQTLPRLESVMPPDALLASAGLLVAAKHEPAVEMAIRILEDHFDELGNAEIKSEGSVIPSAIGGICSFFISTDRESEALARIRPIIQKILAIETLSNQSKAYYKNQIQRLFWGTGQTEEALSSMEEVAELDPDNSSYWYNLSLIYEKLNLMQKSLNAVDKYMTLGTNDDDHLHQAVEIYAKTGRIDDAKKALAQLRKVAPVKAVLFDDDVKKALGMKF